MTFYIKKDKKGMGHIFNDDYGECDEQEHADYPVVARGLKTKKVTCPKCKKMIPAIVMRQLAIIMSRPERGG